MYCWIDSRLLVDIEPYSFWLFQKINFIQRKQLEIYGSNFHLTGSIDAALTLHHTVVCLRQWKEQKGLWADDRGGIMSDSKQGSYICCWSPSIVLSGFKLLSVFHLCWRFMSFMVPRCWLASTFNSCSPMIVNIFFISVICF